MYSIPEAKKETVAQDASSTGQQVPKPTRRRSKEKIRTRNTGPTELTLAQRCEIAQKELDFVKAQFMEYVTFIVPFSSRSHVLDSDRQHEGLTQKIAHSNAMIQELDLRAEEIARAIYEFERDIVNGAVSPVRCIH